MLGVDNQVPDSMRKMVMTQDILQFGVKPKKSHLSLLSIYIVLNPI